MIKIDQCITFIIRIVHTKTIKQNTNKTTQNGSGNENEIQNSFYSDRDMVSEFNRAR